MGRLFASSMYFVPVLLTACQQQTRTDEMAQQQMLVFEDPGPNPKVFGEVFKGTNWAAPPDAPNGNLAASLLACGVKKLIVRDANMDHTWQIAVPKPSDSKLLVKCVSRHAGPTVFRVRPENS